MGEVSFGHKGKVGSSVKFPYTDKGLRAMGHAEKVVRSIASRAKGKAVKKAAPSIAPMSPVRGPGLRGGF